MIDASPAVAVTTSGLRRAAAPGAVAAVSLSVGAAVAFGGDGGPQGTPVAVVGGLGLLAAFTLALVQLDVAVALGFVLIGVVVVEPAPSDALFAVTMVAAAVGGHYWWRRVPMVPVVCVTLFMAANVLSATAASDLVRAGRYFLITLYLCVFAVWLAAYVRSERRARWMVLAYLTGALVVAALSSLALFVAVPGGEQLLVPDGLRAKGFFKDANVYGPFLVPAALLLLQELIRPRLLRVSRPVILLLAMVAAVGVLLSYSRAAWLNLGVGMIVLLAVTFLRHRGAKHALVLLVAAALLGICLVTTISITGSGSFLAERAQLQAYDTDRFGAQESGVGLAQQYVLGVGPGQFELVEPWSAHSLYVRVLAEQGYPGLVLLIALIGFTFVLACANVLAGRDTWGISSAVLLAAWCGILANSAFVDTLHWRHLWLIAGLIWAGGARRLGRPLLT
jgi:O-antigen ligase